MSVPSDLQHQSSQPTNGASPWTPDGQPGIPAQQMTSYGQPQAPAGPARPTGMGALAASRASLWSLLSIPASLLWAIGSVGTWAKASAFGFTQTVSGASRDGIITLVLALVAIAAAVVMVLPATARLAWRRHLGWVIVAAAVISAIVGIYDAHEVSSLAIDSEIPVGVSVGWGLWMVCIFSIIAAALGLLAALLGRSPKSTTVGVPGAPMAPQTGQWTQPSQQWTPQPVQSSTGQAWQQSAPVPQQGLGQQQSGYAQPSGQAQQWSGLQQSAPEQAAQQWERPAQQ